MYSNIMACSEASASGAGATYGCMSNCAMAGRFDSKAGWQPSHEARRRGGCNRPREYICRTSARVVDDWGEWVGG
jgi:hypothetical protein